VLDARAQLGQALLEIFAAALATGLAAPLVDLPACGLRVRGPLTPDRQ
jgi:hypothetical protein